VTVRLSRTLDLDVPPERVWAFLSDPAARAGAISVVDDFDVEAEHVVWHVRLPVPLVERTVAVRTHDVEREPPRYVKFVGRSPAFRVTGEHEIAAHDGGSRVTNTFVVEGRLPGVERFFRRSLDDEMDTLEARLRAAVEA